MVLEKTNGTLQAVSITRERGLAKRYSAGLKMVDENGTVRRFNLFRIGRIHKGFEIFSALQPGSQLEIIYRADRRGSPLPPKMPARIMEMHADGVLILSLAASAWLSNDLKEERILGAFVFGIPSVFLLAVAVFLHRKRDN